MTQTCGTRNTEIYTSDMQVNPHACQSAGTLALTKHTNDTDTDFDLEWLPNQILTTIN